MRQIKCLALCLSLLFFTGCGVLEKVEPPNLDLIYSYVDISCDGIESSGKLEFSKDVGASLVLSKPETLSGVVFELRDDKVSVLYGEVIENNVSTVASFAQGRFLMFLNSLDIVTNTARDGENFVYSSQGEKIVCDAYGEIVYIEFENIRVDFVKKGSV